MENILRAAIVVPVYNEEKTLEEQIIKIEMFRRKNLTGEGIDADIIIANNNSSDNTESIGKALAFDFENILYHHVKEQGKGAAIKDTWLNFDYDVFSFTDVDLSTDLSALPKMYQAIREGYGIAIGSRYIEGADTKRSRKREMISKGYRALFHSLFYHEIADPQCGLKAISREVRDEVLPYVENKGFFFDTELLVRAANAGYKIKEVPVTWTEDPNSTVHMARDIPRFMKGMLELKYKQMTGRLGR